MTCGNWANYCIVSGSLGAFEEETNINFEGKHVMATALPKTPSLKEIVIAIATSVGAVSILAVASVWMPISVYVLMGMLVVATISIAPLMSLYLDYKNPHVGNSCKTSNYNKIAWFGAVGFIVLMASYGSVPSVLSLFATGVLVIAIVFVAPLVSLYSDYRNPHANSQTRKFSLRKTVAIIIANLLAVSVLVAVIFVSIYLQFYNNPFVPNYAESLYKPIDKSMTQLGAAKMCGGGENGTPLIGDHHPHYGASYRLDVGKDQAVEAVKKVASDNGYNLQPDGSLSGGGLILRDESKQSTFADLKEGNIKLIASIYADTNNNGLICESSNGKTVQILSDSEHTAVNLDLVLPLRKDR